MQIYINNFTLLNQQNSQKSCSSTLMLNKKEARFADVAPVNIKDAEQCKHYLLKSVKLHKATLKPAKK